MKDDRTPLGWERSVDGVERCRIRFFFSYAHHDLARVREMRDGLLQRGLNVWFDKDNLGAGPCKAQITKAIASSRFFVIALSNAALRKTGDAPGFLDEELDTAYRFARDVPVKEFTIVPVLLENCDRGDNRLKSLQQFALYAGWEAHLDALAVAIGGHRLSNPQSVDQRSDGEKLIAGLKNRAEAFHYAADYERALKIWDAVLVLEGDSVIAWHNKGNAFRRLHRWEEALVAYERALAVDADHVDTWYNEGKVLTELGRIDDAVRCYERALAISPNDSGVQEARLALLKMPGVSRVAGQEPHD